MYYKSSIQKISDNFISCVQYVSFPLYFYHQICHILVDWANRPIISLNGHFLDIMDNQLTTLQIISHIALIDADSLKLKSTAIKFDTADMLLTYQLFAQFHQGQANLRSLDNACEHREICNLPYLRFRSNLRAN